MDGLIGLCINGLHISDKWDQWDTIVKLEKGFGNQD